MQLSDAKENYGMELSRLNDDLEDQKDSFERELREKDLQRVQDLQEKERQCFRKMSGKIDELEQRHNLVCENLEGKTLLCDKLTQEVEGLKKHVLELSETKKDRDMKQANQQVLKNIAEKMNLVSSDELKASKKQNMTLRNKYVQIQQSEKRLRGILKKKEQEFEKKIKDYKKKILAKKSELDAKQKKKDKYLNNIEEKDQ